jgi:hypothetical protein
MHQHLLAPVHFGPIAMPSQAVMVISGRAAASRIERDFGFSAMPEPMTKSKK